jgi:hypothetical protein
MPILRELQHSSDRPILWGIKIPVFIPYDQETETNSQADNRRTATDAN